MFGSVAILRKRWPNWSPISIECIRTGVFVAIWRCVATGARSIGSSRTCRPQASNEATGPNPCSRWEIRSCFSMRAHCGMRRCILKALPRSWAWALSCRSRACARDCCRLPTIGFSACTRHARSPRQPCRIPRHCCPCMTLHSNVPDVSRFRRLVIVCRTQLDRPGPLTRAVRSFDSAAREAHGLADVSVRVVSDVSAEALAAQVRQLRDQAPSIDVGAWFFPVRSKQLSRIDLLLASVHKAQADFVWFVDDDDFLLPGALLAVARTLRRGKPQLIVGHSRIFDEVWRSDREVATSRPGPLYPANRVLWTLGGENRTPICSAVFPVAPLRERIEGVAALGEYMEDYFLLLQFLTRGETALDILDVELAGVSIREAGNTVTMEDRSKWHRSQAEVVGQALARPEGNNPLLWRLTAELLRTGQEELQIILKSRSWRWTRPLRSASALLRRVKRR